MADQAGTAPDSTLTYCDQCGEPTATSDHTRCATRRELEPPRYCAHCRRRMIVQVVPRGWTARCSEHGDRSSLTTI